MCSRALLSQEFSTLCVLDQYVGTVLFFRLTSVYVKREPDKMKCSGLKEVMRHLLGKCCTAKPFLACNHVITGTKSYTMF
jgi:hypothetical protein